MSDQPAATRAAEVRALSDRDFPEAASGLLVTCFHAQWSAPSRAFLPRFERFAAEHPGISFATARVDDAPRAAIANAVTDLPTIIVFRAGSAVARLDRIQPGGDLASLLDGKLTF